MHTERFSVVMSKIVSRKIPVTFLSVNPTAQAAELVKNLRAQGLNITNLITVDTTPPPSQLDFNVVHLSRAAQIFPQPEYVLGMTDFEVAAALKYLPDSKAIIIGQMTTEPMYETFMAHLPELQAVYESLIDEESKRTF